MASAWTILKRLLGYPAAPATRLTAAQAITIAAKVARADDYPGTLAFAQAVLREGRVRWIVSKGGVGAQTFVEIDDATGEPGQLTHTHAR